MSFIESQIEQLAKEHYGLLVKGKALDGYDELNFLLTDVNNTKYILKIADENHSYPFLEAQVKIVSHLGKSDLSSHFQCYACNREGSELTPIIQDGKVYYLRILSFLEGSFWFEKENKTIIPTMITM